MDYRKQVPYQFFHPANLAIVLITVVCSLFPLPFGAIYSFICVVLVNLFFFVNEKSGLTGD